MSAWPNTMHHAQLRGRLSACGAEERSGQYLSENGKTQLRIAETEKYAHVTFFFNGGVELPTRRGPLRDPQPEGRHL